MDPLSPVVVAGRYRLLERLGVGATSQVFAAEDLVLGRRVALKRLRPCSDPNAAARLRDEARIAGDLNHPAIAAVYDYGEESLNGEQHPYVVMELVEGRTLRDVLRDGGVAPELVASILAQIADALATAHAAGVVHRDVKPGNIVLTPAGNAVLLDFGIARRGDIDPLTMTGTIVGTVDYLSPEQAAGQSATPRSDLYSLGLVAYECLTGVRPLTGGTIPETLAARAHREVDPLPDDVAPALRSLVERMVRRDPDARPADAATVAFLARDPFLLSTGSLPPRRSGVSGRRWRPATFRTAAAAMAAAVISLSGVLLTGAADQGGAEASAATALKAHPPTPAAHRSAAVRPMVSAPSVAPLPTRTTSASTARARTHGVVVAVAPTTPAPKHAAKHHHGGAAQGRPATGGAAAHNAPAPAGHAAGHAHVHGPGGGHTPGSGKGGADTAATTTSVATVSTVSTGSTTPPGHAKH